MLLDKEILTLSFLSVFHIHLYTPDPNIIMKTWMLAKNILIKQHFSQA